MKGTPQQKGSSVLYEYSIIINFFLILSEYTILALRIPFLGTKGMLVLATGSLDVFRGTLNLIK